MRQSLRRIGAGLAMSWAVAVAASSGAGNMPGDVLDARPWSEVEAVVANPGTLKFTSPTGVLHFAPDGGLALVTEWNDAIRAQMAKRDPDFEPPTGAIVGSHEKQGSWLVVKLGHVAFPDAQARRVALERAMAMYEVETEEELAVVIADYQKSLDEEARNAEAPAMRLLRVPYRSGELLVEESSLKAIAKGWDGQGPLRVMAIAWRLTPEEVPANEETFPTFEFVNPLSAKLPIELSGLLRRDAIEGRVVEVLDTPETLKWTFQYAKVRVKLDRGANHGMYEGIDVYGLPPDESFFASVVELKGEDAVAELMVSRFSPQHEPALPPVGLRITTRRHSTLGCPIDTSAAVRAKVLSVAVGAKSVAWDEEGFAWLPVDIDQGSKHGLAVGDKLDAESDELTGEALVTAVQPERATVLWRVQRYGEEHEVLLPKAGDALVTPAWRRAERDTFGSADD